MSFSLSIRVDTARFRMLMRRHGEEIREAFGRGLDRAAEIVERAAKLNLTANKSVAFGLLRASIGHRTNHDQLRVTIGPGLAARGAGSVNYGGFVEEGRGPGRLPPPRSLDLWVKRKLGIGDDEEVARVAFLISRKIARSGTRPAPYLVPALRSSEPKIGPRIEKEIDRTIDRINGR